MDNVQKHDTYLEQKLRYENTYIPLEYMSLLLQLVFGAVSSCKQPILCKLMFHWFALSSYLNQIPYIKRYIYSDSKCKQIKIWFQNRRTKWKRKYTNDLELLAQQYYNSIGVMAPRPIFLGDRLWFFNYPHTGPQHHGINGPPLLSTAPNFSPHQSHSLPPLLGLPPPPPPQHCIQAAQHLTSNLVTPHHMVKCFREGRERVENELHDHRPRTSLTKPNTDRADALIHENRRITIKEIGAMLSISVGSVEDIVKYHLHYRKVNAWWVPCTLMDMNKMVCMQAASHLLQQFEDEGDAFLKSTVTTNEMWVHYFIPEAQ
ncbi:hypothetical protein B7P43_G12945 [Cryptotermes secundus]|uniref:Homeobox domain-containing protein n=1 Tax=Cryptotermes secundus TaxID=105785 RepID=A0A2J7Q4A0_9NEOP|nr:hypothetical protein B7P43_G12945 [Cryptotermes secundus]